MTSKVVEWNRKQLDTVLRNCLRGGRAGIDVAEFHARRFNIILLGKKTAKGVNFFEKRRQRLSTLVTTITTCALQ